MKLLVVDDAVQICEGICKGIDWKAYGIDETFSAYDGAAGLRAFEEKRPEIVIADVRMPGMDGLELSRRILRETPETRIILLSAYAEFSYAQEALRLGVAAYELKPVRTRNIIRAVAAAAEQWKKFSEQSVALRTYQDNQMREKLEEILLGQAEDPARIRAYFKQFFGEDIREQIMCAVLDYDRAADMENRNYVNRELADFMRSGDVLDLGRHWGREVLLFRLPASMLYRLHEKSRLLTVLGDINAAAADGATISAGLSDAGASVCDLAACYKQAVRALDMRLYTDGGVAFGVEDAQELLDTPEDIARISQEALELLEKRDADGALRFVEAVFGSLIREKKLSGKGVYLVSVALMRALEKAADPKHCEDGEAIAAQIARLEDARYALISDYRKTVLDAYQAMAEKLSGSDQRMSDFARNCAQYIRLNYRGDLKVADMAAYFDITPNYFSHVFNREFGVSFSQFLNITRIKRAQELLKAGNMRACDVASYVGFRNYKYFNQVFRRLTGHAPTRQKEE